MNNVLKGISLWMGCLLVSVMSTCVEAADYLQTYGTLQPGMSLVSANGQYYLAMQADGNLVLYNLVTGRAQWSTKTTTPGLRAVLQGDGNFVLYSSSNVPFWSTGTVYTAAARLVLQNDGNLVLMGMSPVWQSNTAIGSCGTYLGTNSGPILFRTPYNAPNVPASPDWNNYIASPNSGSRNMLTSTNGCYSAVVQSDRNFVIYRNTDGKPLWSSNTWRPYTSGSSVWFQPDGNVALRDGVSFSMGNLTTTYWQTNSANTRAAQMIMQNDGNLVLYTDVYAPVWSAYGGRISYWAPSSPQNSSSNTCIGVTWSSSGGLWNGFSPSFSC